jgi:hypothetical protein
VIADEVDPPRGPRTQSQVTLLAVRRRRPPGRPG